MRERNYEKEKERQRKDEREIEKVSVSSFFVSLLRLESGYLFPMQDCVE